MAEGSPIISHVDDSTISNNSQSLSNKSSKSENHETLNSLQSMNSISNSQMIFICSIIGVERVLDDSVINHSHIEYIIEFTRLSDGAKKVIQRRYRQLRKWYNELVSDRIIPQSDEIFFPKAKGITSPGYSLETDSEFVQNRLVELQTFLRWLFANNPFLYQHQGSVFFFNLEGFTRFIFATGSEKMSPRVSDHDDYENW